jgi:hypothetical protein
VGVAVAEVDGQGGFGDGNGDDLPGVDAHVSHVRWHRTGAPRGYMQNFRSRA